MKNVVTSLGGLLAKNKDLKHELLHFMSSLSSNNVFTLHLTQTSNVSTFHVPLDNELHWSHSTLAWFNFKAKWIIIMRVAKKIPPLAMTLAKKQWRNIHAFSEGQTLIIMPCYSSYLLWSVQSVIVNAIIGRSRLQAKCEETDGIFKRCFINMSRFPLSKNSIPMHMLVLLKYLYAMWRKTCDHLPFSSWESLGSILEPFWSHFGPILVSFRSDVATMLVTFPCWRLFRQGPSIQHPRPGGMREAIE